MKRYGVFYKVATSYHLQTSGQVQLFDRELKSILEKMVDRSFKDQFLKLNDALSANQITNKTPLGITHY